VTGGIYGLCGAALTCNSHDKTVANSHALLHASARPVAASAYLTSNHAIIDLFVSYLSNIGTVSVYTEELAI